MASRTAVSGLLQRRAVAITTRFRVPGAAGVWEPLCRASAFLLADAAAPAESGTLVSTTLGTHPFLHAQDVYAHAGEWLACVHERHVTRVMEVYDAHTGALLASHPIDDGSAVHLGRRVAVFSVSDLPLFRRTLRTAGVSLHCLHLDAARPLRDTPIQVCGHEDAADVGAPFFPLDVPGTVSQPANVKLHASLVQARSNFAQREAGSAISALPPEAVYAHATCLKPAHDGLLGAPVVALNQPDAAVGMYVPPPARLVDAPKSTGVGHAVPFLEAWALGDIVQDVHDARAASGAALHKEVAAKSTASSTPSMWLRRGRGARDAAPAEQHTSSSRMAEVPRILFPATLPLR